MIKDKLTEKKSQHKKINFPNCDSYENIESDMSYDEVCKLLGNKINDVLRFDLGNNIDEITEHNINKSEKEIIKEQEKFQQLIYKLRNQSMKKLCDTVYTYIDKETGFECTNTNEIDILDLTTNWEEVAREYQRKEKKTKSKCINNTEKKIHVNKEEIKVANNKIELMHKSEITESPNKLILEKNNDIIKTELLPVTQNIATMCSWDYEGYHSDLSGIYIIKTINQNEISIQLLRIPIVFLEEFGSLDDGNTIYGIVLTGKMLYKTRKEIESILFDRGFCCEKTKLSDTISMVIAHDRETGTMVHRESYECIGVHYSLIDKDKLVVAYPQMDNIRIIPQDANPLFEESMNEVLKYDITSGHELADLFFKTMNTFDESIIATVAGWACSSPFYYVLRNTKIDVFPMMILHGGPGTGKSKLLELFTMNMFGLRAKAATTFDTNFRFDAFRALTTLPIVIEEVDSTNDEIKSAIKSSAASSSQGSFRGTSTQQVMIYKTRTPIVIASNAPDLWEGDRAIREGRSIFIDVKEKMYNVDSSSILSYKNSIDAIVSSNKLFGYFFLNEVVKLMNNKYAETNSEYVESIMANTNYTNAIGRLNAFIDDGTDKIKNDILITGSELSDDRRYTIWGLVKTGLVFMHHVFSIKDENGSYISSDGREYTKRLIDNFTELIVLPNQKQLERTQVSMLDDMMTFINLVENSNKYEDARNSLFTNDKFGAYLITSYCITSIFLTEYNRWARQSGAKQYKGIASLANEISAVFDIGINEVSKVAHNPLTATKHRVAKFPMVLVDSALFDKLINYQLSLIEPITLLDLIEKVDKKTDNEIKKILK